MILNNDTVKCISANSRMCPIIHTAVSFLLLVMILLMLPSKAQAEPLPIMSEQEAVHLVVDPSKHELTFFIHGRPVKKYRVALGNPATPSPVGQYEVVFKGKHWGSGFGTRWMGLNVPWGIYGIHGTNRPDSIGHNRSHGCVRMRNRDVEELFERVPVGTKVTMLGHVLGGLYREPRRLAEGDAGGDVLLIQNRLQAAGLYEGECNGRFRGATTTALKRYQRLHGLPEDGVVSKEIYQSLGLWE